MTAKHAGLAVASVAIVTALTATAIAAVQSQTTILWMVFWVIVVFVLIAVGQLFFRRPGKA